MTVEWSPDDPRLYRQGIKEVADMRRTEPTVVETRMGKSGIWQCWIDLPIAGYVCIAQAWNEYRAQTDAARFLDGNYPDLQIEWKGGYHGGDASQKTGRILGRYQD